MSVLFAVFAAIAVYALEFVRARVPEARASRWRRSFPVRFAAGERRASEPADALRRGRQRAIARAGLW